MAAKRYKLKAGKRAFEILATQAIGHDLLKGVIELVTNSDDSYTRQSPHGDATAPCRTEIEVDRRTKTKKTVLRVIDYAEGMAHGQMKSCVGEYGEDTSGHSGRGVFGMGLKDTINAFGEGRIISFKNGMKSECRLYGYENFEVEDAVAITRADTKLYRNTAGGTVVEILITYPKIRIPQMETLGQQIKTHVCLRSVVVDASRQLSLRDISGGTAERLTYRDPDGLALVNARRLELVNFPNIEALLTVCKATGDTPLTQSGSSRTGGILITSKRSCHESTLFGFDDDPFAAYFFGELRCDQLYDLQVQGEQIVDKNRNGLKRDHPITKALFEAARKIIDGLVKTEREAEKKRQEELENAQTSKRFRSAIDTLNKIARNELQIGGAGGGNTGGGGIGPTRIPQDGLEFIPDDYRIVVAEKESLKLRVQVDGSTGIGVGDKISVTCDNPNIRIIDPSPAVSPLFQDDPPISIVSILVEGDQANAQGFITAKLNDRTAIATVEVVSSKAQRPHQPRGGLFRGIKYEETPAIPRRARFDRNDGMIWINTAGPCVDLYFGSHGEGQEQPANQLLVAELVTELACQEIARVAREKKTLDLPPGVDHFEAAAQYVDKLKGEHSPDIHRILVNGAFRKK